MIAPLDPGRDGENVDAVLEQLRAFGELGVQHVHGMVPGVSAITPLEIIGERIIPVAATF